MASTVVYISSVVLCVTYICYRPLLLFTFQARCYILQTFALWVISSTGAADPVRCVHLGFIKMKLDSLNASHVTKGS